MQVIAEVAGLYRIVAWRPFRRTPGVMFDMVPLEALGRIDGIDRVLHAGGAQSPGPVGEVAQPWYMHPDQDDNLLVLAGRRRVEIYSRGHGRVECFEVTPDSVDLNGRRVHSGPVMLVWPRGVFHRIVSDAAAGSASLNFARRYEGFDLRTNFNIYDLDSASGEFRVIRPGHLDQG